MSNDVEKIKKDLIHLYTLLYPQNAHEKELLSRVFSKDILRLLKHLPNDVESALSPEIVKPSQPRNSSVLAETIHNKEDVRQYFAAQFETLFGSALTDEQFEVILTQISLPDLKYLYSCLIDVPLPSKVTKREVLYKIRDFFNTESRTSDIMKTLY